MEDYFCKRLLYPPVDFCIQFRMRKEFLNRILNDIVAHKPYFTHKIDACGQQSLSREQKLMAIIRMLAYGGSADSANDHVYGQWYLHSLNPADHYRLLHKASHRGFLGMLGGQFTSYKHKPTVVLEAVASYDTWIWHAFFGVAGSNNDINVLACSPLFNDIVNGVSPHIQYVVSGNEYNLGYYLVDDIYSHWATLVKMISQP
ncbi:unnamed protein product [Prunus armeniaca]